MHDSQPRVAAVASPTAGGHLRDLTGARLDELAYFAAAVGALAWIWSTRHLPLQDYPDWLRQARLFALLLRGELPAAYAWAGWPAPNAISTLAIGALALVMPVDVAGKLLLSAYACGFLLAAQRLIGTSAARGASIVPLNLLFNHALLHGNLNYALSLPVFCAASTHLLTGRPRARSIAGYALLLYACHAITLCVFALLLAVLVLSRRRPARLAFALVPALLLGLAYVARRATEPGSFDDGAQGLAGFAAYKLGTVLQWGSPFFALHPFYEPLRSWMVPVLALNAACCAALCWFSGASLVRALRARDPLGLTALLLLVAFALAPRSLGGLINPGERLLLPVVLLLARVAPARFTPRAAPLALTALFALQLAYTGAYSAYASQRIVGMRAAIEAHAAEGALALIPESHFDFGTLPRPQAAPLAWKLLPRHHPLLHQAFGDRGDGPIFETGLFAYRGRDRVLTSCRELAQPELPAAVLVIGDSEGSAAIAATLGNAYQRVAQGEGFLVIARTVRGLVP